MSEKLHNLTKEQKAELNTLTTAEEVLAFAKRTGIDLTYAEAAEIASRLPDDLLEDAAGGRAIPRPPISTVLH